MSSQDMDKNNQPQQEIAKPKLMINGYDIIRLIGHGGMSKVYLATQLYSGIQVAVKVITPQLSSQEDFKHRFTREMLVIKQLKHPNIVTYFDSGVYNDYYYIAMEHLNGSDLKTRIKEGKIRLKDAVIWLKQIAEALNYAHTIGFLHRDIKPENIMFREDNTAVVTDFGIAKAKNSTTKITSTGMSVGTPHYMSPEQARGKKLDHRSDIYSFGVMMFELLTGRPPYDGNDSISIGIQHITKDVPKLPKKYHYWQPILNKLMEKKVGNRYRSLNDFIVDLDLLQKKGKLIDLETLKTKDKNRKISYMFTYNEDDVNKTYSEKQRKFINFITWTFVITGIIIMFIFSYLNFIH